MKENLLESVIVATDFSEGAQRALDRAARLRLHPEAEISLVHVVPRDVPGTLRAEAIRQAGERLTEAATAAQELARAAGRAPLKVTVDVLEGSPAKQIVKRARAVSADLLVLGRHGRRPFADVFLGTTAQKVLRQGSAPMLLVQLGAEVAYERVLVGVSLESGSARVLKASTLVAPSASVEVFHASHVPFEDYVALSGELATTYRDEYATEASLALESLMAKAQLDAKKSIKPGDPRRLLLEEVQTFGAQLLVMGTHGRKGLERLVLGSVAEWVLANAAIDVLVIRT
jgi:nucleotide-binding universal stress UspA family protein